MAGRVLGIQMKRYDQVCARHNCGLGSFLLSGRGVDQTAAACTLNSKGTDKFTILRPQLHNKTVRRL